ncbi:MAG: apolipoprotein N-acyltransferase [Spartobacteria bacterium]|nr:apolipoprotein N-acyltransferase [Spartobacteria bacterium]
MIPKSGATIPVPAAAVRNTRNAAVRHKPACEQRSRGRMPVKSISKSDLGRMGIWAGPVLTGLGLAAAFPPFEIKDLAWLCMAPLMISAAKTGIGKAARLGFVSGLVFWLFSIHWITHVTYMGWMTLAAYCALYFIPLPVVVSWWVGRYGTTRPLLNIGLMLLCVLTWVGFEYLRSVLLTGFPWNPVGVSQHANITIIQVARLGGVYAVSAVVLWVNAAFAVTALRYIEKRGRLGRHWHPELMAGVLVWACVHSYGWRTVRDYNPETTPFRVALVQPNIPQVNKWTLEYVETIYSRLRSITAAASHVPEVDLIVWPETAVPDDVRSSVPSYNLVMDLCENGVPILVGSMDTERTDEGVSRYYNSSFLFDREGRIVDAYDKQHLVLFGEYVPYHHRFPFISSFSPIEASFSPGTTATVFRVEEGGVPFAVLICFEDTLPGLSRKAVRNGARVLINQTNDAWFDVSSGSRQHMLHCIFRCVENGVPAVRATNTGLTCFIDPLGRVPENNRYPILTDGFIVRAVEAPREPFMQTLYTRTGDIFAVGSLIPAIGLFLFIAVNRK